MKNAIRVLAIFTSLAAVAAGGILTLGLPETTGAPQEAALAALCLAIAVIPYVFLRSLVAMQQMGDS